MAKTDRRAAQFVGEEDHILHLTWSRSGKNLIVTVARDEHWRDYQQVLLSPEQSADVARFLVAGPDDSGGAA
jgi:hypothetical protein